MVRTRDEAVAADIRQCDEDIDRLYWLVAKQYGLAHLAGTTTAADWLATGVHNYRLVAKPLERIGDHAERITLAATGSGRRLDPKLLRRLDAVSGASLELLERAFTALMARDDAAANEAVEGARGVQQQTNVLLEALQGRRGGGDLLGMGVIVDSIGRTAGHAADIAEVAINHVMSH